MLLVKTRKRKTEEERIDDANRISSRAQSLFRILRVCGKRARTHTCLREELYSIHLMLKIEMPVRESDEYDALKGLKIYREYIF